MLIKYFMFLYIFLFLKIKLFKWILYNIQKIIWYKYIVQYIIQMKTIYFDEEIFYTIIVFSLEQNIV